MKKGKRKSSKKIQERKRETTKEGKRKAND